MPYIRPEVRSEYTPVVLVAAPSTGVLNFQLTVVVRRYLAMHGLCYATCNDIVGALDNCKDEFRRRIQHPYEDEKIKENGDVYD